MHRTEGGIEGVFEGDERRLAAGKMTADHSDTLRRRKSGEGFRGKHAGKVPARVRSDDRKNHFSAGGMSMRSNPRRDRLAYCVRVLGIPSRRQSPFSQGHTAPLP